MTRPPFSWFGSKARHLKFLAPLLPTDAHCYVEPFGGGAAVMLSRDPSPIETYNDMNGDLVNFFMVLRNDLDNFIRLLDLTPYSREEFETSKYARKIEDPTERARLFFLRASTAYAGRTSEQHCYFTTSHKELRRGIPDRISRYLSAVENLSDVANRMKTVQIEKMDGIDLIRKYDGPGTLFYCDPPYLTTVRKSSKDYDVEVGDLYHRTLSTILNGIEGRAAISGYDSPLYDTIYSGWLKHVGPVNRTCENHAERREVLWTNYDPSDGRRIKIRPTVNQTDLKEHIYDATA
ncbi:MAG: DNA adenine methylase [Methanomassiliicoccaceae archaeon]|jgi:DNA adenine methylase|nr:DNA adenine methylase [Methanomassiliicoccaceae archaeon]